MYLFSSSNNDQLSTFLFHQIPQPTPYIPRLLLFCSEFFFHHSVSFLAWLLDIISGWSGYTSSTLADRNVGIFVGTEVKDLSWSSFNRQLVWQCKFCQREEQQITILKTVIVSWPVSSQPGISSSSGNTITFFFAEPTCYGLNGPRLSRELNSCGHQKSWAHGMWALLGQMFVYFLWHCELWGLCKPEVKSRLSGASLVAQWLRIRLPMQGTRVRALAWEDPTCCGATRPVSHNYWACASGACAPQQERPR